MKERDDVTTKEGAEVLPPLNLAEMNALLWNNALRLRDQELTPAVANATASTVGTILRGVKLQMEYAKANNRTPTIPLLDQ